MGTSTLFTRRERPVRNPNRVTGRKVSGRELEKAFAKFRSALTERQQAIVYQAMLTDEIQNVWSKHQLQSDTHQHGPLASPLGYGPQGSDALGVLINLWRRDRERTGFSKGEAQMEEDRETLKRLQDAGTIWE